MTFLYRDKKIKVCDSIFRTINKYLQNEVRDFEAGGILIGRENISNNNLIIEFATCPMENDKRSRFSFDRKDVGHIRFFQRLYCANNEVYAYIGEWHTHPEKTPLFSSEDLKNWKKIYNKNGGMSEQFHIIAGYETLKMWAYISNVEKPIEIFALSWREITNGK